MARAVACHTRTHTHTHEQLTFLYRISRISKSCITREIEIRDSDDVK